MPNHWHLLLWPRTDGELSEVMRWITVTHTQRWHAHRHSSGTGPVYQGRFKSFPVQTDEHFLTVARYVERNALRAKLVERAENWKWSSICRIARRDAKHADFLSPWPRWNDRKTGLNGSTSRIEPRSWMTYDRVRSEAALSVAKIGRSTSRSNLGLKRQCTPAVVRSESEKTPDPFSPRKLLTSKELLNFYLTGEGPTLQEEFDKMLKR